MGQGQNKSRLSDRIIDLLMIVVLILMVIILIALISGRFPFPNFQISTATPDLAVSTPTLPITGTATSITMPGVQPTQTLPILDASIYPSLRIAAVIRNLGDQAGSGKEQWRGFELAEAYFKEQGIDIDLVLKGSGSITETIELFDKLGTDDDFLAIAGPTFSAEAEIAVGYVITAGIPVLGISNTQQDLIRKFQEKQVKNYVRVSAPVEEFVPYALRLAFDKFSLERNAPLRNIAIVYDQQTSFTRSEAYAYQKKIADLYSNTDVVSATFVTGDEDFITQITSILTPTNSEDHLKFSNGLPPDLVIVSGLIREGGMLVQQLREHGYSGLIIGGNGLNAPDITNHCHSYCFGLIVAQSYDYRLDSGGNKEFKIRYKDEFPGQFAAQAFASVQVIVQALEKLDNREKNKEGGTRIKDLPLDDLQLKLNEILHSGEKFSTVVGDIKITIQGEVEQDNFASSIFKNGKFIIEE